MYTLILICDCTLANRNYTELTQNSLHNALVNLIPHYPPPGPTRAIDKGIDERPFSQGGAFDTAPSMCVGLSQVC